MNGISDNCTATLYSMAETLRIELRSTQNVNRAEAMRLVKLYFEVTNELYRRERLKANAYKFN